jgi:hypothetical protein
MRASLLLLLLPLLTACDGPVGPAGPAGPPGAPASFAVATFDYSDARCELADGYASCAYLWPALTADVVSGGAVLAYREVGGAWVALPHSFGSDTDGDGAVDQTLHYTPGYSAGRFEMQISFGAGDVASVGSGRVRLVALSAPADKRAVPYAELAARLGF